MFNVFVWCSQSIDTDTQRETGIPFVSLEIGSGSKGKKGGRGYESLSSVVARV